MPPGSVDINPSPASIVGSLTPLFVFSRYFDLIEDAYTLLFLPNVICLQIDETEGPHPSNARFQYVLDDSLAVNLGWPAQFEQLWPLSAVGNYVVQCDDEIVVATVDPSGNPLFIFDGFAQIPQIDIGQGKQAVTFSCVGVSIRLWDTPIKSIIQREASLLGAVDTSGLSDTSPLYLPCRFNPSDNSLSALGGYKKNAVAAAYQTAITMPAAATYAVFQDPLVIERDSTLVDYWTVGSAVKYLIQANPGPEDLTDQPWVNLPFLDTLDSILTSYSPVVPRGVMGAAAGNAFQVNLRDFDASNKPPMDAISELLNYAGFVMRFETYTDQNMSPGTALQIERRDNFSTAIPKPLFLAANGAPVLDMSANNATSLRLARDTNEIINQFRIETAQKRFEITVYLAPAIAPTSGDATFPTSAQFLLSKLTGATNTVLRKYRWYIADETGGDGHWNSLTSAMSNTPLDLSPLFAPIPAGGVPGNYVYRYRPGSRTLISKDINGKPLHATLEIAIDTIAGNPLINPVPGGVLTWFKVTSGWRLLPDRLGIAIDCPDVDQWHTGNDKVGNNGIVRGIFWLCDPPVGKTFKLRLTTVIEMDERMNAVAHRRIASPTSYKRERISDGKDHFQYGAISVNSLNYADYLGDGTNPVVLRDDTKAAREHCEQLRSNHEFPRLAGQVTIPYWTDYYDVGDRIQIIYGRNAPLSVNVGAAQGEAPSYPWVTARTWQFQHDKQQTILQLSDHRAEKVNL